MNHPLAALFDQFLKERRFLKNVTEATLVWYRVAFTNYRAAIPSDTSSPLPTKTTLQQFVVSLRERGIRPVTWNTYIGAMNAFCAWLHEEGHTRERVKLTKLRVERRLLTLLTDAEMRALIGFKPKTLRQARVHLAVLILDTGLRVSEALHLRSGDIDCDNLILKVFGKGQKERLVPFSPELRRRLYRYQQLRAKKGISGEFLFGGFEGTRWEKRNSASSLYLLQDKLGLPRFGWHRLRHTFATNYLRQGGDIVRLSMVLGHTQITTTQRYLHLVPNDLSAQHQRVSILGRLG